MQLHSSVICYPPVTPATTTVLLVSHSANCLPTTTSMSSNSSTETFIPSPPEYQEWAPVFSPIVGRPRFVRLNTIQLIESRARSEPIPIPRLEGTGSRESPISVSSSEASTVMTPHSRSEGEERGELTETDDELFWCGEQNWDEDLNVFPVEGFPRTDGRTIEQMGFNVEQPDGRRTRPRRYDITDPDIVRVLDLGDSRE